MTASPQHTTGWRIWFARAMVAIVFAWNVLCALQFVLLPEEYAMGYGLAPTVANGALVSGIGVAFLMWNVTYPLVIANPARYRVLFGVVLAQQLVGLLGETIIWLRLSGAGVADGAMAAGIMRFVVFDAAGLVMMGVAFALMLRVWNERAGEGA